MTSETCLMEGLGRGLFIDFLPLLTNLADKGLVEDLKVDILQHLNTIKIRTCTEINEFLLILVHQFQVIKERISESKCLI